MLPVPDRYDKGFVWDDNDEFVNQDWVAYKRKIRESRGGIGIAAADFNELLSYGRGRTTWERRRFFSTLVQGAEEDEDLDLLARIVAVLYVLPADNNLTLGWFFHQLRRTNDEFDAERAARVLNLVYEIHYRAGMLIALTLGGFSNRNDEDEFGIRDEMIKTGLLSKDVLRHLRGPAPTIFLSYAREDSTKAEQLFRDLDDVGFIVWKDSHELLPGEQWEVRIRAAFRQNEFAILCLSATSIRKRGFFQVEVKLAQRMQQERPADDIYIIPVKFDQVGPEDLPEEIRALDHIDLAGDWTVGVSNIVNRVLEHARVE